MPVVVGYVPTAEGRAALRRAAEEAVLRQVEIIVVNSQKGGHSFSGQEAMNFEAELEQTRQNLRAQGLSGEIRMLVRRNSPAEDLAAAAQEYGASMIVVGLRRQHPVVKALSGSDLLALLAISPCPVMAVAADAG